MQVVVDPDSAPKVNEIQINKRYIAIKKIGRGGSSDIYLGWDTYRTPRKEVAIKIMRADVVKDEAQLNRFKREIAAISRVKSKHVVQIIEKFEYSGRPAISMEYVPGHNDLKKKIRSEGALFETEAVEVMKSVLLGLEAAHDVGLVHRDIKPQNVMITQSGVVKLCDFGIAKGQDSIEFTKTQEIVGSVQYIPPEVVAGDKETYQSDIYSAGIVLFEMLTGELPYDGSKPLEIARKHCDLNVPSILKYNENISKKLASIVAKATSKDLEYRYATVKAFFSDLCNYKNDSFIIEEKTDKFKSSSLDDFGISRTLKLKNQRIFYTTISYILMFTLMALTFVIYMGV